jgi:hypothetical protein
MTEELKPCPFCGKDTFVDTEDNTVWCRNNDCNGAIVIFPDPEGWNSRPIEDALRADLADMTADRDSEQRWANEYHGKLTEAEKRIAVIEEELTLTNHLNSELINDAVDDELQVQGYSDLLFAANQRIAEFEETSPYEFEWMKRHNAELAAHHDRVVEMQAELDEYHQLMDLQHRRTVEADKRFQAANQVEYFPDLGQLVEWLMTQTDKANQRIDELEAAARWVPVGERLPEDNEHVIGAMMRHGGERWISYDLRYISPILGWSIYSSEVTHWMPLPPPPVV